MLSWNLIFYFPLSVIIDFQLSMALQSRSIYIYIYIYKVFLQTTLKLHLFTFFSVAFHLKFHKASAIFTFCVKILITRLMTYLSKSWQYLILLKI